MPTTGKTGGGSGTETNTRDRGRKRQTEKEQLQQHTEQRKMPRMESRDHRNSLDAIRNNKQHSSLSSRHRSPPAYTRSSRHVENENVRRTHDTATTGARGDKDIENRHRHRSVEKPKDNQRREKPQSPLLQTRDRNIEGRENKSSSDQKYAIDHPPTSLDRQRDRERTVNQRNKNDRHVAGTGRERKILKQPRSKSRTPPIRSIVRERDMQKSLHDGQRHGNQDQQSRKRRLYEMSPVRKVERREIGREHGEIGNKEALSGENKITDKSGFDTSSGFDNQGFGNSCFANSGFTNITSSFGNSGFDRRERDAQTIQRQDSQGKPRILAPGGDNAGERKDAENQQQQSTGFNLIVNELSAASIKREDNPLKGTRGTRRSFRGGGFTTIRGGGRGSKFGVNNANQPVWTRGGTTFGGIVRTTRSFDGATNLDGRRIEGAVEKFSDRRITCLKQNNESEQNPQITPVNPLAVPRGRNYFLHDHRDAFADDNRLYDPRLDRGNIRGRGGGTRRFMRGGRAAGFENRGGTRGIGSRAPLGWRNFGTEELKEQSDAFSRGGFYHRGGGFVGANSDIGLRPSWRSKADEDSVWKHDKYVEVTQEDTKLELLDEVDGEPFQHGDETESRLDIYVANLQSNDSGRERYQHEEYLYENDEELVYD